MTLAEPAARLLAEENTNPILPDVAEMVVGIFAFLVVLAVIGWKLGPRISKQLEERSDAIEGGIKRAEEAQAEANELKRQYQEALEQAQQDAGRIREEAKAEGAQIIVEMREQAQTEAQRVAETARAQIEAEKQQAFAQLRGEIGRLAVELSERIVGESMEDETRRRGTVDRFLDDLEERAGTQEQVSS